MKKAALLMLIITGALMFASCAKQDAENGEQTALAEGTDATAENTDFVVDGEEPELNSLETDSAATDANTEVIAADKPVIDGAIAEYVVEKNDTMMLIAFNIYGDYSKWKDLQALNPGVNPNALNAGTVLRYTQPAEKFVWNPQGNPFLIKGGDTLGTISNEVYTTPKKWKDIFDNNRPMIKDPNLIFAGFTLYYIPESKIAMENQ